MTITYRQGLCSHCFTCARDFYNKVLDKCPHCGGLCSTYNDRDMQFMERRQTRGEIYLDRD